MIDKSKNLVILFCVLAVQVIVGWQKWADVSVDYGRELYVPWRLSCGDVLYKDLNILYGPFSYYWNTFLFKLFGPSINTLVIFNILLTAVLTLIIYKLFTYVSGYWAAFLTSLTFLVLFAFNQYYAHQGFNYICPYTYSLTYAMFLSVLAIYVFVFYCRFSRSIKHEIVMGFTAGLVSLTRLEIFFPLLSALTIGLLIKAMTDRGTVFDRVKSFMVFFLGLMVPVVIAGLFFSRYVPHEQLWQSIFNYNPHWKEVYSLYFYQHFSGLDDPKVNSLVTARWALNDMAYIAGLICWGKGYEALLNGKKYLTSIVLFLIGSGIVYWIYQTQARPYPFDFFRGLPVLILIITLYLCAELFLHRFEREQTARILPKAVMALFSLLLIVRVFLKVRIVGAGFVFAMPGVLLAVMFLAENAAQMASKNIAARSFIRSVFLITWVLVLFQSFGISYGYLREKKNTIGGPGDQINYDENTLGDIGGQVRSFLGDVDRIIPQGEGFVVFPEGIMLNFLSKHKSPLPYVSYMPAEMVTYQEQNILKSFQKNLPMYIVLYDVDNLKYYGYRKLGRDYAPDIVAWILRNYQKVWPGNTGTGEGHALNIYKRPLIL